MKLIDDAVVDLAAPVYVVTGTAAIDRISDGQVMLAYFQQKGGQNVITHYAVWAAEHFEAVQREYERFRYTHIPDLVKKIN